MDKPYYPCKSIASIEILARTLGVHPKRLISIANKSEESYAEYELSAKNRVVFEPKYELKKIQKRINSRIFEQVKYPSYLQGGIKSESDKRDYVENAKAHAQAETLISLDIKKFYTNIKAKYVFEVYKYFFNFPDDVSELLVKLTTYKGVVPQGGCTSSYIANLIFFNSEYRVVSALRGKSVKYSRLLDDVTLSSTRNLDNLACSALIRTVVGMFTKKELKLNTQKTKIEYRGKAKSGFEVTGLWVEHKAPKMRKKERKYIRQLVYVCEKEYAKSSSSSDYHKLWNKTSGLVAKLAHLEHKQATDLRKRLREILPTYDSYMSHKIKKLTNKLLKVKKEQHNNIGRINDYNKLLYKLGILARTEKKKATNLKTMLKIHYAGISSKREFWLE
mgnify:CR=1 FL=1